MLTIFGRNSSRTCDSISRRDFLRVGALGLGGLTLPALLRGRAAADIVDTGKSVVLLWLGGGATHIETFDPKMEAPGNIRSTVGEVTTPMPGVTFGGLLPKMASVADRMAVVRAFCHANGLHGGGTHWMLTGRDFNGVDQGESQNFPSFGSVVSRVKGATSPHTGMPTYVAVGRILYASGSAWLGPAYEPFEGQGEAAKNLERRLELDRISDRRQLLRQLDSINREIDVHGTMKGMDAFEQQAFDLVTGERAKVAFDIDREDQRVRDLYGESYLAEQLLVARRLCEAGTRIVTVKHVGWDMHKLINEELKDRCPDLDQAVHAFIVDCRQRELDEKILLVITGEFGRTPYLNQFGGRDHWPQLSTLAFAGGGLKMGQVIGKSCAWADEPLERKVGPEDLLATTYHVLGVDGRSLQFPDRFGRPIHMLESGEPIKELF